MTTLAQTESTAGRNFNLRAYLAGGAATTALIVGAIIVFTSLAAYVAFNGLPIGGGDSEPAELTVGVAEAPTVAASALGATADAVAASAAATTTVAPASSAGNGQNASADSGSGASSTEPAGGATAVTPTPVTPSGGGSVGATVDQVGNAAGLPLGAASNELTAPIDQAVDSFGPDLGGQVGGTLDDATGATLGESGLADSLLP
jgi:hypothetical protein